MKYTGCMKMTLTSRASRLGVHGELGQRVECRLVGVPGLVLDLCERRCAHQSESGSRLIANLSRW